MPGKPKKEDLFALDRVSTLLRELTGVTRTRATVYNWVKNGRPDCHGNLIKLKTYVRLGQMYTTKQAVIDFITELG